jgi:hypothetical protein
MDDIRVKFGETTNSFTDFESEDISPWAAGPSPEGTPNAEPQWFRTPQLFEEGAVVGMNGDSVYAGFEIATMKTAEERASFMREALEYLGLLGG